MNHERATVNNQQSFRLIIMTVLKRPSVAQIDGEINIMRKTKRKIQRNSRGTRLNKWLMAQRVGAASPPNDEASLSSD